MHTHGHLHKEALRELEEQFGNEELVAGAYLKTNFDHTEISENNFTQLRSFYNTLHVCVSTQKIWVMNLILQLPTTYDEQSRSYPKRLKLDGEKKGWNAS